MQCFVLFYPVAYCDEASVYQSVNVTPSRPIQYGDVYTLTCSMTTGNTVIKQRTCGYDRYTGTYKTFGDEMVCPGNTA